MKYIIASLIIAIGVGLSAAASKFGYDPTVITQTMLTTQLDASTPRYKARLQCDVNGDLTVTFPANTFPGGIIPVLSFEVEAPATDAATYSYFVNVTTPPTNTTVVLKVTRALKTPVISILGSLNLFTTPGTNKAWVHIIAVSPT